MPAQRAPDLFTFVFAAIVSLAPSGGEGRGEGASVTSVNGVDKLVPNRHALAHIQAPLVGRYAIDEII